MSPPSWLHWPDVGGGPDLTISGITDATNGTDNDPVASPSVTGLSSFRTFAGTRIIISFDSEVNRNAFVGAYPDGSSVVFTYNGTEYTASSISWDTASIITQARLEASNFLSFPASVGNGHSYSFDLTLA